MTGVWGDGTNSWSSHGLFWCPSELAGKASVRKEKRRRRVGVGIVRGVAKVEGRVGDGKGQLSSAECMV